MQWPMLSSSEAGIPQEAHPQHPVLPFQLVAAIVFISFGVVAAFCCAVVDGVFAARHIVSCQLGSSYKETWRVVRGLYLGARSLQHVSDLHFLSQPGDSDPPTTPHTHTHDTSTWEDGEPMN